MDCCLVIDISKIGLKIMATLLREDKIFLQEVHRFSKITFKTKNSNLAVNVDKIIKEINESLMSVKEIGYNVKSISVNSSILDFAFLDEENDLLNEILVDYNLSLLYLNRVVNEFGTAHIYRKTGVNFNSNNTLYRLMMFKDTNPEKFSQVKRILSFSDYVNYRLTGNIFNEKIGLSLTQFFNFKEQNIDYDILNYLDLNNDLDFKLIDYGKIIGECKSSGCTVISPYGNNLTSSFLTTNMEDKNSIFIVNSNEGVIGCTENFSKMYLEGLKFGFNHQLFNEVHMKLFKYIPCYRFVDELLKNIENNYMLENVWKMVNGHEPIDYIIDFDSDLFKNSTALLNIIKYYFDLKLNSMTDSISNFVRVVYDSFAVYYKKCIKDLEKMTGGIFDTVCMVGDYNSNNFYNQFIADVISKDLEIGPKDSGVIGNSINQFITLGKIQSTAQGYEILKNSFSYKKIKYSGKKISYKYFENII